MNRTARQIAWLATAIPLYSQVAATATNNQNTKAYEAAVSLENTLTTWAFAIFGGSILLILGTSYYRPRKLWQRGIYLIFLPGWAFLAASVYKGTRVQEAYLASLFAAKGDFGRSLNSDLGHQIDYMVRGLFCFGIWLLMYFIWWMLNHDIDSEVKK